MVEAVEDVHWPHMIPMEKAPDLIRDLVASRSGSPRQIVGITGPVGAGKSTLARELTRPAGIIVATDDYLPDYSDLPEHERDDPKHADLDALATHLAQLRLGMTVESPVWCFKEHRRVATRRIEPAMLIVCEGIHAFDPRVRQMLDVAVYVEAPADQRWRRWEAIERAGERGWGIERARQFFEGVAEPTFAHVSERWRASADVVVVNPG
ncbi:MAG: AAA family ATPase [Phycisphaeraceae bacterium]|nr:AAA family ATPase [Phycisphaeraceae bacterium]